MKKHYNNNSKEEIRKKIMGFGEKSVRKNFFPDLQSKTEEHKHGLKLLDQISDAICFIDTDTLQIIDHNYAFSNYFSDDKESIKGRIFINLLKEKDKELIKKTFNFLIDGNSESDKSVVLDYLGAGESADFIGETSFSLSSLGDSNFIIAVIRDITKRVKAENELQNLNAHLERKVEERTQKLKEINSELQQFAYVVSHDLKAPLRGISQLAYWLQSDYSDVIDEEGKDLINMLIQRVNILDDLIAGILQYSRVGRTDTDKELVDLQEILDEVAILFEGNENLELQFNLENNYVVAHKIRIEQIFQNLIDNAIRYNDKDKTIISIESFDLGSVWKILVKDNGPGIDKKYHDKIFQIFQTLQEKNSDSTGIGLALIKKIVEMYNGHVFVESEPGKGTSFIINIPKE